MSLVEVVTGSVIAFVVSIWANWAVLPLFGFHVQIEQSFAITLVFSVISIIRSYLVRRFFEVYLRPFMTWWRTKPTIPVLAARMRLILSAAPAHTECA